LVAGVATGADGFFGTVDDAKITGGTVHDDPNVVSKIDSVVIGGQIFGTPGSVNDGDQFGFVAEWVASFEYDGTTVSLRTGAHNDGFSLFPPGDFAHSVGSTGDVTVREV
jgi:hypothetical protein